MKIIDYTSGGVERSILIDMITNAKLLNVVANLKDKDLFGSTYANIISRWCIHYFQQYGDCPGKNIIGCWERWSAKQRDKELVETIGNLLEFAILEHNNRGTEINDKFAIDRAADYFESIRFSHLSRDIQSSLDLGHLDKAREIFSSFKQIAIGDKCWSDPLTDERDINDFFSDEEDEILIKYPGPAGKFFSNSYSRDCLVGFLGPDKSMKSYWLLDIAYRALADHRRVAYFEVGDLSKKQVLERLYPRITKHPYYPNNPELKWPCFVKIPTAIQLHKDGKKIVKVDIDHEEQQFTEPMEKKKVWDECQTFMRDVVKTKRSYFRLSCHPNDSINVDQVRAQLIEWSRENWVADVVIIDYADILAPPNGSSKLDKRQQVDKTWKGLRRISQEFHCLVVTATQANKDSYTRELLDKRNFSESKTIMAHVTAMFGINMGVDEKEKGYQRINSIVKRKGFYSVSKCLYTANCIPLSQVCAKSAL